MTSRGAWPEYSLQVRPSTPARGRVCVCVYMYIPMSYVYIYIFIYLFKFFILVYSIFMICSILLYMWFQGLLVVLVAAAAAGEIHPPAQRFLDRQPPATRRPSTELVTL